jgi:hypothetical protein
LRSVRGVASIVVFAVLLAVGFLPLFGGPGYEQSLASGLVVPLAAAIAAALEGSRGSNRQLADDLRTPLATLGRALGTALLLAGVAYATALIHGARVGICDFWGGTAFFVLTAGFGGLVGGAWGAVAGEVARGRRHRRLLAVLLAILGPLGGIVVSVARFYASPMIFAYDPFFGYFSGTLYDTVVDVRPELWTYRAGTIATLAAAAIAASLLTRAEDGGLRVRGWKQANWREVWSQPRTAWLVASGALALAVSLAVTFAGATLGHWQTATTIARELGGRAAGPRCDVVHPDSLLPYQVDLLVRDCEEELAADEERLGTHLDGRVTAFVFADANQKRRLMGAAETQIAKPWRREVYVQYAPYPHPVLGHEIAHVVAGSFAHGPFHVGGGVVPNPGLIEGVAVATSPDDDELTDAQWARAMLDLGTLPDLRSIFSLEFLGGSAQKSYTLAGAFVGWVLERWGAPTLRAWYGGGSLEALTGASWPALDAEFRAWLKTMPMPPEATAYARAKFERPSVWARKCPHVVDALNRDADRCRDEQRLDRADGLYARALGFDPRNEHARLARAKIAVHRGSDADADAGRADLARVAADEKAPRTWRDRAEEAMADDDLVRGDAAEASARYRAIAARTLDEDVARTLEVKALAARDPASRRAIVDLLLTEPGRAQDSWLGALSVGQWAEASGDPLAAYLVGKNLNVHDRWQRAAPYLDRLMAAPRGAVSDRVGREVLRQRAIGACVTRDEPALARVRAAMVADGSPFAASSGGRRDALLRLMARCDR